jgi:muconolactone delta-isomerase
MMEFLVEFNVRVPPGTPIEEVREREDAEAAAAANLARHGRLVRLWTRSAAAGETYAVGLYRARGEEELDGLLGGLPLNSWMEMTVTPLEPHPNDPGGATVFGLDLPVPVTSAVYRLEAQLGEPIELGITPAGQQRIVPLTGGSFAGPGLNGTLIPGASADWQTVRPDGTVLGDIRYVLETGSGDLLSVEAHGIRHGSAEVLGRLARGEDVDASAYTFRTSTRITTAAPELDWLNKGIFISVAGRTSGGVIYETYLVA